MGYSMRSIPFFSDEIAITPHSASRERYLLRGKVTIREFANGKPCSLYELDNGEYLVRLMTGEFMQGKES